MNLGDLVDLGTYPIDRPGSVSCMRAVQAARVGLRSDGCAVVKNLVRSNAVRVINGEIVARKHTTHFSREVINPYFHMSSNP